MERGDDNIMSSDDTQSAAIFFFLIALGISLVLGGLMNSDSLFLLIGFALLGVVALTVIVYIVTETRR